MTVHLSSKPPCRLVAVWRALCTLYPSQAKNLAGFRVNEKRWLVVIFGPVPIITASLAVTEWYRGDQPLPMSANNATVDSPTSRSAPAGNLSMATSDYAGVPTITAVADDNSSLARLREMCEERARVVRGRLDDDCEVIVRSPYVIAGDLSRSSLSNWYEQTIGPATRAMQLLYFRTPPDAPTTVYLFGSEESYDHYTLALFGESGVSVYGYYKPTQRTLVMNISTGGGTLVHELTHALMDFDFPRVPDWFNEGLASLHEECQVYDDERGIVGRVNWRLPALRQALAAGELRTLESMATGDDFRGSGESVNYAQARYLCMFMQQRGVLTEYFHQFRANHADDPNGDATLLAVFDQHDWASLNTAFRRWVGELDESTSVSSVSR